MDMWWNKVGLLIQVYSCFFLDLDLENFSIFIRMASLWSIQPIVNQFFLVHVDIIIKIYSLCLRWCFYAVFSLILFHCNFYLPLFIFLWWTLGNFGPWPKIAIRIRDVYGGNMGLLPIWIWLIIGNMKLDIIIVFASLGLICKFWYNLVMNKFA